MTSIGTSQLAYPHAGVVSRAVALVATFVGVIWTLSSAIGICFAGLLSERLALTGHRIWARGVLFCFGIRVRREGLEKIPKGAKIISANHASIFDIPVLAAQPFDVKWIAKAQVRKVPLVGWGMMAMRNYFLRRDGGKRDLDTMRVVEVGLLRGDSVGIFPEGTRTRTGAPLPLRKGAFRMAVNTGVPIVPIAIGGTFPIAPPGRFPQRIGFPVTLVIGDPIRAKPGETAEALMARYEAATATLGPR